MGIGMVVKIIAGVVVVAVVVVIGASFYFALTTPAGQQGLAGDFQSLGSSILGAVASIFSPITALFNGIGNAISNFFSHL